MDEHPERRTYYPDEEETALSQAILEAVEAHGNASLNPDEFDLFDHVNPDAIDMLFEDTSDIDIAVRIDLSNVMVSIWSDGGIDIRVVDSIE